MLSRVLNLFLELDSALKLTNDETMLCEKAVKTVGRALNAETGSVMLVSGDRMRVAAGHAVPPEVRARSIGLTEGPAGEVYRTKLPLKLDGELYVPSRPTPATTTRSAILAPLWVGDHVIGVMCLGIISDERKFSDSDLQVLTLAANRVAGAIENAQHARNAKEAFFRTVRALVSAVEAKDPYTAGHCERVANFSVMIAHKINRSPQQVEDVRLAALLHDVGKIGVPESILLQAQKLSAADFDVVKTHVERGYAICEAAGLNDSLCNGVRCHHERYDGSGYPLGLAGTAIPLEARIIAVADTYDAMTTTRPYRKACSHEAAVAELVRVSGSQLDPSLTGAFLSALEVRTPAFTSACRSRLQPGGQLAHGTRAG